MAHICGPVRYATGLLKTKEAKRPEQIMTWDALEGEITCFIPDMSNFPSKCVYFKKTYKASDFSNLQINITAGDIVSFCGTTNDGEQVGGVIKSSSVIRIEPLPPYTKECRDSIEIVDLDDPSLYEKCEYKDAQQHRSRVLTGSLGLEGSWSEWINGKPEKCAMNREYQYRKLKQRLGLKEEE